MARAAPLVRGRTRDIDFRYLALPPGLEERDRRYIDRRIQSAMVYPDRLRERKQRWVFFKTDHFAVAGVVCLNSELAETGDTRFTKDASGRDIYLFAGYVLRERTYLPMEIGPFASLLGVVEEHWEERGVMRPTTAQRASNPAGSWDRELPATEPVAPSARTDLCPDQDDGERAADLALWPTSEDENLWRAAFASPGPISLCLGLPSSRYAVEGFFSNASIEGLREPVRVKRDAPVPAPVPGVDARQRMRKGTAQHARAGPDANRATERHPNVWDWFFQWFERRRTEERAGPDAADTRREQEAREQPWWDDKKRPLPPERRGDQKRRPPSS